MNMTLSFTQTHTYIERKIHFSTVIKTHRHTHMQIYITHHTHTFRLGETALHMGIVSENPEIVRLLLKSGAAVDVRCSGNFFTCDDLKGSRTDS